MTFSLSPGQAHDAPEGRKLLRRLGGWRERLPLLMDRAWEVNNLVPHGAFNGGEQDRIHFISEVFEGAGVPGAHWDVGESVPL